MGIPPKNMVGRLKKDNDGVMIQRVQIEDKVEQFEFNKTLLMLSQYPSLMRGKIEKQWTMTLLKDNKSLNTSDETALEKINNTLAELSLPRDIMKVDWSKLVE